MWPSQHGQIEEVGVARNSRELAKRPAVDPHDEPSAEWGWHGSFPRAKIIAGVICHPDPDRVPVRPVPEPAPRYLWLVGTALVLVFMIWRQVVAQRNAWRR